MQQHRRRLGILIVLTALFGLGHHVDHVIRGNHVGWPLIEQVTPFTYSLGFYPFILLGGWLWLRGRVAPLYWALLAGAGFLFVGLSHFGPLAVEPPRDILGPYAHPAAGYAALAWLVIFVALLALSSGYAARLWWQRRRA